MSRAFPPRDLGPAPEGCQRCQKCERVWPLAELVPDRPSVWDRALKRHVRVGEPAVHTWSKCRQCNRRIKRLAIGVHPDDANLECPDDEACAICGKRLGSRLQLDHCHETGRFRGWLCQPCNMFARDRRRMIVVLRYVMEHDDRLRDDLTSDERALLEILRREKAAFSELSRGIAAGQRR